MLRFSQEEGILTRVDAMRYIGQRFRIKADLPHWATDEAICDQLMRYTSLYNNSSCNLLCFREHVCVHLDKNNDKFNLLM